VKDNLFSDSRTVKRSDDDLQVSYTTEEVISRIWREHLRPRWRLLALAGLAMALSALSAGALPKLIQLAADDIIDGKNTDAVYTIVPLVVAVTLVRALSSYVSNVAVGYLGHRFIADLRIRMFEKLSHADLSWIQSVHSGRFIAGFLNDANMIRQTASRALVAIGEKALTVFVLICVMLYMDLRFSGIVLLTMPIAVFLLGRQRRKMRKSTTKSLQETGDLSALISQTLSGIRIVRAYQQEDSEIRRATNAINRALEFTMRGARARAASGPLVEVLVGCGFAAAIYWIGTKGITGAVTKGHFLGFMAAALMLYEPLKTLATLQTAIQEGVAAASRIFGIIDRPQALTDPPDAKPLELKRGEIVFDNVSFAYDDDQPVLRNVSLTVPAGKTVALVGHSGSGKSTMINLVLRFFEPQEGRVLIDGQDIAHVTAKSLRDAIALVTQDPVLFDDTMIANIAYGGNGVDEKAVIAAAKAAAAHEFIAKLPEGYQTRAGEAGNILSGGEKQRIAIARAIFKDAPILLLDEPTSSLDSQSEEKVQKALEKLIKGRTVLMIAHRLSTVKKADLICVLEGGCIVEQGRHDELLAKNGVYAALHRAQYGGAEEASGSSAPSRDRDNGRTPRAVAGE